MKTIILQLTAPLQSYGHTAPHDVTRGAVRPAGKYPTKSAVVGMAITCFGYRFTKSSTDWNPAHLPYVADIVRARMHAAAAGEDDRLCELQTAGNICASYGTGTVDHHTLLKASRAKVAQRNDKGDMFLTMVMPLGRHEMAMMIDRGKPHKYPNYVFPAKSHTSSGYSNDLRATNGSAPVELSVSEYIAGQDFTVWFSVEDGAAEAIAEAFRRPREMPSLGRACCLNSKPLLRDVTDGEHGADLASALNARRALIEDNDGNELIADVPVNFHPFVRRFATRTVREARL